MRFKQFIQEQFDYKKEHGHDRVPVGSTEWYFHNYEHGYKHCSGGEKNPYKLVHTKNGHEIDKEYARGHGVNTEPQWFQFTKRNGNGWDLESGKKVSIDVVPKNHK